MANLNRRDFVLTTGAAGLSMGLLSPSRVLGANDRVVVAIAGVNSRGNALAQAFARSKNVTVGWICDVDQRAMEKCAAKVAEIQGSKPQLQKDFRKVIERSDVDALAIATPDFWQTPAAIMAMKAGKHVYVEKPASHNPHELELLVKAQKKYKVTVQLGTQQRSNQRVFEAEQLIKDGIIGKPYFAKCWYSNQRASIGRGKKAPAPDWLDYELWQGPVPRQPYMDNRIHYNWHWFRHYGTGESCNNATHQVDVARWLLGADYPTRITSSGGRYHFDDDWEFFDTQTLSVEYGDGKSIVWEGRSCNPAPIHGRSRGVLLYGTDGSMVIDGDGYVVYEKGYKDKPKKSNVASKKEDATNTVGAGNLTDIHTNNLAEAIQGKSKLAQPIAEGAKSVLLCHLANISQFSGRALRINPKNGRILGDPGANRMWRRRYQRGWEPRI